MNELTIAERYWDWADRIGRPEQNPPRGSYAQGLAHGRRLAPWFTEESKRNTIASSQRNPENEFLAGIANAFRETIE